MLALRARIVRVSVWSMFRRGQCFGVVSVQMRLIFEVPQGLSLAGICATAPKHQPFQNIDIPKHRLCRNIESAKPLTAPKHRPCQNIDRAKHQQSQNINRAKTLTASKYWQCQIFDSAKILTMPKHRPCQNIGQLITHAELDWSKAQASDYKRHILCRRLFYLLETNILSY